MNAHTPHSNTAVADVWFGWASFLDKPTEPFGTYVQGVPGLMDYVVSVDVPLSPDKQPVIDIYQTKVPFARWSCFVFVVVVVQRAGGFAQRLRTHNFTSVFRSACAVVHHAVWWR
jgi:hypothetical protein